MKDASAEFIAKENEVTRQPTELYHFWQESGNDWYYTSSDILVEYDENDYVPATLSRSAIAYNAQLEVSRVSITLSFVTDPVIEFIASNPIEKVWVEIKKAHLDVTPIEPITLFLGQIKSVRFQGNTAIAECVGFEFFLKREMPKYKYQSSCNHTLYGDGCFLFRSNFKVTTNITLSPDKRTLTSEAFAGFANRYFSRGLITFGESERMIISHTGSQITLRFPIPELVDDDEVDVYPGCDKQLDTCSSKFNNTDNFLGFPYIPTMNPILRD